jgi:hypothetical protein
VPLPIRLELLEEFGLLLLQPFQSLEEFAGFLSGEHDGIAVLRKEEQAPIPNLHGSLGQRGNGFPDLHFGYSAFVERRAAVRGLQVRDQLRWNRTGREGIMRSEEGPVPYTA